MGPERDRPKERAETDGGQTEAPPSEATYRRVGARSPSQATNIQILPNFFRSGNRQASSEFRSAGEHIAAVRSDRDEAGSSSSGRPTSPSR